MQGQAGDIIVCYPEKIFSVGFLISFAQSIITLAPPLSLSCHIKLGFDKKRDVSAEATGYKLIPINENQTREVRYRFKGWMEWTDEDTRKFYQITDEMIGKGYDFFSVSYWLLKSMAFIGLILGSIGALKFSLFWLLLYFPIGLILKRLGKNTFHCAEGSSKTIYAIKKLFWFFKFGIGMPYIVDLRCKDLYEAGILEIIK